MAVLHVSGHRQMSESDALVQRILMMATGQDRDIARTAGKAYM